MVPPPRKGPCGMVHAEGRARTRDGEKKGCPLTCSCSCRSTPRRRACTLLRPRRRRIAAGRRGGTAATPAARRGGSGSRTGSPPGSHPSLTRRTRRRRRKGPPGPPAPRAAGPGRTRCGRPGPGSASDSGFLKRRRVRIRPVPLRSKWRRKRRSNPLLPQEWKRWLWRWALVSFLACWRKSRRGGICCECP